jgi:hypothetical protein
MENFVPEIRLEAKDLPSTGLAYPDGTYFTYRTYLFGEVQKLSASKNLKYEDILRTALSGIRSNIDVQDLTIPDAMYLSIARKISTLGSNDVQIKYMCKSDKCDHINDLVFSQANIEFNELKVPEMPITAEINGKSLEFDCLRVRDLFEISSDNFKKKYPSINPKERVSTVAKSIRNIKFDEVYEFLSVLNDPDDMETLEDIDKLLAHDIKSLKHSCTKCGHENDVALEGREILIRPFRTGEKSTKNKIHFGKKSVSGSVEPQPSGL